MVDAPQDLLPPVRAPWRGWAGVRVVLLAVTAVVLLAAVVTGERAASWDQLRAEVASGRVASVEVVGDLPTGDGTWSGTQVQEVRWRDGWWPRRTEVRWVQQDPGATVWSSGSEDDVAVVEEEVGGLLRGLAPGVRVERAPRPSSVLFAGEVLTHRVVGWVAALAALQGLAGLVVLVNGPDPRRATRWAWFWLTWLPLGTTAFLLLSGPLPGRPWPPRGRRLRGGWSFLLVVLLGGAVGGAGAL